MVTRQTLLVSFLVAVLAGVGCGGAGKGDGTKSPPGIAGMGDGLTYTVLAVEVNKWQEATFYLLLQNASEAKIVRIVPAEYQFKETLTYTLKVKDDLENDYSPSAGGHPLVSAFGNLVLNPGDFIIVPMTIIKPVEKAVRLDVEISSMVLNNTGKTKTSLTLKREKRTFPFPALFNHIENKERSVIFFNPDAPGWFQKWAEIKTPKDTPKAPGGKP